MKGSEMFTWSALRPPSWTSPYFAALLQFRSPGRPSGGCGDVVAVAQAPEPRAETVHVEVHDGGRVERQHLRDHQTSNDGDAERPSQLRAHARAERERK